MHDWSKEIDQMESQWEKRRNHQQEKRQMEAEEQRAQVGTCFSTHSAWAYIHIW